MRPRASAFIATSLDGYIARPNGSIDWLSDAQHLIPDGEDCGYNEFMDSIDGLVMGRHTFERVLGFDPWPYGDLPVYVMTHSPVEIPPELEDSVSTFEGTAEVLAAELHAKGHRHLYVDGGLTIQSFLRAGLLDDVTITLIPVLLGSGRPLFGPLAQDVELTLLRERSWDFGFVQLTYEITTPA